MAERAVLVRERPAGQYAVAESRWGGTDRALAAVCAGRSPTALPGVSWEPRGHTADVRSLASTLDYLSTAVCYDVRSAETTAFRSLWFGLPIAVGSGSPTAGALVAVESLPDARALRTWFRRLKGHLTDALVAGHLPAPAAALALRAAIAGLAGRERYLSVGSSAERLSPETGPDSP